jgi:hypothetical protein
MSYDPLLSCRRHVDHGHVCSAACRRALAAAVARPADTPADV